MTETESIRLVAGLMAPYRVAASIPDETFDAYVEDLADLDYEPAALAVKQLRQTATFLPSIAEIRKAAVEITAGHLPDGDQAWAEVTAQIRAIGWTGRPAFTHPAIADTVTSMGWRELCASTNQVADRAHFLKLYGTCRDRLQRARQVDPAVNELAATLAERYQLEPAATKAPAAPELPKPAPVLVQRPMRELLEAVRTTAPEPRSREEQLAALRAAYPADFATEEALP